MGHFIAWQGRDASCEGGCLMR